MASIGRMRWSLVELQELDEEAPKTQGHKRATKRLNEY